MTDVRTGAAGLAGLLATTLAVGFAGSPASAVVGAPAGSALPFVVKIDVGERACSGALVAPRWVVTSSTCFAENGPAPSGSPKVRATATVGRANLTTNDGHVADIVNLVPRTDRNLVLARLAFPATGVPTIPIAGTRPEGPTLRAAGYGRTATEWVPDVAHVASFAVGEVGATTVALTAGTADASICKGDSGGPVFQSAGDQASLYAINNTSWQRGCLGSTETRDGATATRLDDIKRWIEQNTRELPPDDFDADGKADLLVIDSATGNDLWWTPNTSTAANPSRGASVRISEGWRSVTEQRLADYDGDGRPDIVGRSGDQLMVWRNTSTGGTPTYAPLVALGTGWNTISKFSLADVDRDGKQDILGFDRSGDQLWFIPNTSTVGAPARGTSVKLSDGFRTVTDPTLADWDGDGKVDLLGRSVDRMFVRLNTSTIGKPSFAPHVVIGDRFDTLPRTSLGDFNADGKVDIVGWDGSNDQLWFIPNTSTVGKPSKGPSVKVSDGWRSVSSQWLADYDGDGKVDILGRHAGNTVMVWLNRSSTAGPAITSLVSLGNTWGNVDRFITARQKF